MAKTVAIPKGLAQVGKQILKDKGYNIIETENTQEDIIAKAPNADGLILMTEPFDNETIGKLKKLKIIARHGVGYDNLDQDAAGKQKIWVTITPNANAATVAETTLAMIFVVSKNILKLSNLMLQGHQDVNAKYLGFDLAGKKLGIMGYGRIGKMVAKKAANLDMDILIYDPFVKETKIGRLVSREELLKQADVITLHLAVTEETKNGIGREEFEMMKPSATLINLGRGALIDEAALINALQTKQIAQAALDVFEVEPLPTDSPFFNLDNVILTPHIASNTVETMDRMATDAANEIVRVLEGNDPNWPVNQLG